MAKSTTSEGDPPPLEDKDPSQTKISHYFRSTQTSRRTALVDQSVTAPSRDDSGKVDGDGESSAAASTGEVVEQSSLKNPVEQQSLSQDRKQNKKSLSKGAGPSSSVTAAHTPALSRNPLTRAPLEMPGRGYRPGPTLAPDHLQHLITPANSTRTRTHEQEGISVRDFSSSPSSHLKFPDYDRATTVINRTPSNVAGATMTASVTRSPGYQPGPPAAPPGLQIRRRKRGTSSSSKLKFEEWYLEDRRRLAESLAASNRMAHDDDDGDDDDNKDNHALLEGMTEQSQTMNHRSMQSAEGGLSHEYEQARFADRIAPAPFGHGFLHQNYNRASNNMRMDALLNATFSQTYQQSPYQQSSYQQSPYQQSPYQQSPYQQASYQQTTSQHQPPMFPRGVNPLHTPINMNTAYGIPHATPNLQGSNGVNQFPGGINQFSRGINQFPGGINQFSRSINQFSRGVIPPDTPINRNTAYEVPHATPNLQNSEDINQFPFGVNQLHTPINGSTAYEVPHTTPTTHPQTSDDINQQLAAHSEQDEWLDDGFLGDPKP